MLCSNEASKGKVSRKAETENGEKRREGQRCMSPPPHPGEQPTPEEGAARQAKCRAGPAQVGGFPAVKNVTGSLVFSSCVSGLPTVPHRPRWIRKLTTGLKAASTVCAGEGGRRTGSSTLSWDQGASRGPAGGQQCSPERPNCAHLIPPPHKVGTHAGVPKYRRLLRQAGTPSALSKSGDQCHAPDAAALHAPDAATRPCKWAPGVAEAAAGCPASYPPFAP